MTGYVIIGETYEDIYHYAFHPDHCGHRTLPVHSGLQMNTYCEDFRGWCEPGTGKYHKRQGRERQMHY